MYHSPSNAQPIRAHDGRIVASVQDGRLVKHVSRRKHFYLRYGGWAADVVTLDQAQAAGATVIEIHDSDSGTTYETDLATFRANGRAIHHEGHGAQVVLPLRYWRTPELQPALEFPPATDNPFYQDPPSWANK